MNSKIEYAYKNYITFVHWYLNMWFSWLDETQEIYCLTTNNETGVSLAFLREKKVKCQREPVNKVSPFKMAFRRDYVIQISGLKHDKITFIFCVYEFTSS